MESAMEQIEWQVSSSATDGQYDYKVKPAEPKQRAKRSPVLRSGADKTSTPEWAEAERRVAPPASALPCLIVTTASKDEIPPLPGPRKKQGQALVDNIKWMAAAFGVERVGFLTLTLGDKDAGGRFRNLRDRKEAQRRFHSFMTNEISKHYLLGVTITERHRNGGLHFHLVLVCKEDIRGSIDFDACFPPKGFDARPVHKADYSTANQVIKREWAYLRRVSRLYGFGRHQLQPMRKNAEALGRYLGEYLRKDWNCRLAEDKGARCVRYFGHWSTRNRETGERRKLQNVEPRDLRRLYLCYSGAL
jgi:hypothetical protein